MQGVTKPATNELISDPGLDLGLFQEEFCTLIGMPESIPVPIAISQLMGGLIPLTPENQEKINYILACAATLNPTSILEAQLLIQLLAAHQLCTKMLKTAADERWPENIDKYVNIAMKLSRGYKNGLESLGKYRRDGKQYFFIERVHIEKDTNAIIGNIERG